MTETKSNFDDVPFEPADYGRLKVEREGSDVYLVTWKDAIAIDAKHATQLGFDLIRKGNESYEGEQ
jgi:hypothetical protein